MDIKEALRILGIEQEYEKTKLKKKYRELMRLVHPDNGMTAHEQYKYSAQEINEAYSLLFSLQNAYKPAHNEVKLKKILSSYDSIIVTLDEMPNIENQSKKRRTSQRRNNKRIKKIYPNTKKSYNSKHNI